MSNLLEGKLALVLGIANRWSLAYAIAQAYAREGATLVLTYLGERQKDAIEDLSKDLNVAAILPCDVTKDEELAALTESLRALGRPLHAVLHSLAFANREDLSRPFVETSRNGFLLAQDVSAYQASSQLVSTFTVQATMKKGKDPAETLRIIDEELAKLGAQVTTEGHHDEASCSALFPE